MVERTETLSRQKIGSTKKQYKVNGKWTSTKPKKRRSSRRKSRAKPTPIIDRSSDVTITDTKTGFRTRTVTDKIGSSTVTKTLTDNRIKQEVAGKKRARDLLNQYGAKYTTEILRQREEGINLNKFEKLSTQKFFAAQTRKTQEELSKLTREEYLKEISKPRRFVDRSSQVQAFKIAVNQELRKEFEPTISFNEPVAKFQTALTKLEKDKKSFSTKGRKGVKESLKTRLQSTENKLLTGQSVTPKQKEQYLIDIANQNKALTNQQIKAFGKIVTSPTRYGISLANRFITGEKNPIFNDLISFSKGLGKGLKSIFVDPLVSSYNYGVGLVDRAYAEKTMTIKILKRDLKKVAKGIKSVSTFVKNNPTATGIIVGTAVASGLALTKAEFKRNPVESLGFAIAFLFPGTVLSLGAKGTKVGIKTSSLILKKSALEVVKLEKAIKSSQSLVSLKIKLVNLQKQFKILKGQKLTGKDLEKANKIFNKFKNIIDKPISKLSKSDYKKLGYTPLDTKTPKVPKTRKPTKTELQTLLDNNLHNKKEIKQLLKELKGFGYSVDIKKGQFINFNTNKLLNKRYIVKTPVIKVGKKVKGLSRKQKKASKKELSKFELAKQLKQDKGKVIEVGKTKTQVTSERKKEQWNGVEWGIRFDKANFRDTFGKKGQVQIFKINKVANKEVNKTIKIVNKIIKKNPRQSAKTLRRGHKKKSVSVKQKEAKQVTAQHKEYSKKLKELRKTVKSEIQDIKRISTLSPKLKQVLNSKLKLLLLLELKLNNEIKSTATELIKLSESSFVKATIQKSAQDTSQVKITSLKFKSPTKPKTPKKIIKVPPKKPKKPKTPKKPKKIRFPRFTFDSSLPKGYRLKFNAVYKSKGKFVRLKLGLPLNKAYKRVGQLIDRTTDRSMKLMISGITKVKDDSKPSVIKKFGIRKSKDRKVLTLVEKTKHIIDTKGEKRGLTIARLLKKKKSSTKIKKVVKKSIKRKKKSSKNRSKSVKRSKL